jgi:hypothetical protein
VWTTSAEGSQVPIKRLHKMSEAQIQREAAVHALVSERTVGTLPWQHLVLFRKHNRARRPPHAHLDDRRDRSDRS